MPDVFLYHEPHDLHWSFSIKILNAHELWAHHKPWPKLHFLRSCSSLFLQHLNMSRNSEYVCENRFYIHACTCTQREHSNCTCIYRQRLISMTAVIKTIQGSWEETAWKKENSDLSSQRSWVFMEPEKGQKESFFLLLWVMAITENQSSYQEQH